MGHKRAGEARLLLMSHGCAHCALPPAARWPMQTSMTGGSTNTISTLPHVSPAPTSLHSGARWRVCWPRSAPCGFFGLEELETWALGLGLIPVLWHPEASLVFIDGRTHRPTCALQMCCMGPSPRSWVISTTRAYSRGRASFPLLSSSMSSTSELHAWPSHGNLGGHGGFENPPYPL